MNVMKGVFVQVGSDMEEAARVSGAGWMRTYFQIWLPLLMPSLMLLAVMNFVSAAGATGSIILLASRDTMTLSLMALELSSIAVSNREAASIISIFIIGFTMTGALIIRYFGLRLGVRHDMQQCECGRARCRCDAQHGRQEVIRAIDSPAEVRVGERAMLPRRPQRGRAATKRNRSISRKDAKAQSKKPKTFGLGILAPWREEYPNPKFPTLAKFAQAAKNLKR